MRYCSINGCERKHDSHGYCISHTARVRKYGDPFIVKQERHGMDATPESCTWAHMKQRCYNPKDEHYKYYGARGITVCDEWRTSFSAFFKDMGLRPSIDYSLERIDNDGNYEPSNCKWIPKNEQSKNRRKPQTYKGRLLEG